jgi:G3E family GTPase
LSANDQARHGPLPVTVIGGYLGAGKTTLVNHLLREADGRRLAILVNEFGTLPIDADLIEAQDENVISIAGGCVCCSYGNDLMMAMIDLAEMAPKPDHVLLEASGVAMPGAIASSIGLLGQYALDGVIVLADAETVRERASDTYMADTVTRQLSDADIVLLNKADLVSPSDLADTRTWLASQNTAARTIDAVQSSIPIEVALGVHTPAKRRSHGSDHLVSGHFETATFVPEDRVDVANLAERLTLEALGIVRAKGFVKSIDGTTHAIQVVGQRWTSSVVPDDVPIGLVCIGPTECFDQERIKSAFRQAGANS